MVQTRIRETNPAAKSNYVNDIPVISFGTQADAAVAEPAVSLRPNSQQFHTSFGSKGCAEDGQYCYDMGLCTV